MRVWQVPALGEPAEVMALTEVPAPDPAPGHVVVEVLATALNFPDVLMARGLYQVRPPLPFVPGIEVCGRVVEVGAGVTGCRVGDRVVGMPALPHGGLAEQALLPADALFPAPEALDDAEAAALTVAFQTAYVGLTRRAALRAGETVLVHAAAGGVGSAAVQVAKALGATVIGVVGSGAKVRAAVEAGADHVLDRSQVDLVAAVRELRGEAGVDVVFDPVGGRSYDASTKVVAFEGRIVVVGFASGVIPQPPLSHALVKNYSILGLHWGLYRTKDPALVRRCHDELMGHVAHGAIQPLIADHLPFDQAPDGLTRLAAGDVVGRLTVAPPA
jgi:NADPH:quinone reductase